MNRFENYFLKNLNKESTEKVPLYCTGYPEVDFIRKYSILYELQSLNNSDLILCNNDYSLIKNMGFDAISIWEYRVKAGGYKIDGKKRVDPWGRIYIENWYQNDGVFKNENIIDNWQHLNLPVENELKKLNFFLKKCNKILNIELILSIPGLFEKTWQSMGLLYFSKCIKRNIEFVKKVRDFFFDYVKNLINLLQKEGSYLFIIADDCAYKNGQFLSNEIWRKLFFKEYKEIVDLIHKKDHNHKVILHSDGYISNILSLFIEIGFDAVESLEPASGVDIFSLFKKFKNQICFIGNLDVSNLIYKSPQDIKSYVQKLISSAKSFNCPLIISPTQQINSKVKPENIKAMIDATKL